MIITLFICASVVASIFIICHVINKMHEREIDTKYLVDNLQRDMEHISYIIKTISENDLYGNIKDKFNNIKRITENYE